MSKNDPAFPVTPEFRAPYTEHGGFENVTYSGLTKREWFAGMALAGIAASNFRMNPKHDPETLIVKTAYLLADAMLAESEGEG